MASSSVRAGVSKFSCIILTPQAAYRDLASGNVQIQRYKPATDQSVQSKPGAWGQKGALFKDYDEVFESALMIRSEQYEQQQGLLLGATEADYSLVQC